MIDPAELRTTYHAMFDRAPRAFFAPGRVNLIGEHTDYNDGFVLPVALELGTTVLGAPRDDGRVRVHSRNLGAKGEFFLDAPGPGKTGRWVDYVEGVAQALLARGHALHGADLVLASDVPRGAGLSSSAALEIAVGFALLSLSGEDGPIDRVALAKAGQSAEHQYVGTRCGIMDQLVSACASAGAALLVDCRSLATEDVLLPVEGVAILVTDTRKKHSLASSEYNTRRAECERAVELLGEELPGIAALRDVGPEDLERHAARLPDPVLRRARHVVSENARTLAAARALRAGDVAAAGALFVESHRSLQHDYEVSVDELDHLVDVAISLPGVYGARMTGGGFGGSTVSLVDPGKLDAVTEALRASYVARFGKEPGFLVTRGGRSAYEIPA
jgi:galactokinase